ncbi:hypothetical protein [Luteolibacter sp. AS25]|uniref:hypothetical protein n=1 Tax=Luteolibacter sp. AS25 TaxID=3135776 RepID=UPI00398B44F7
MDKNKSKFSIASLVAIIAAILSFQANVFFGLVLAAVAFIFGAFGIVLALSPKTRGGAVSIIAVILSFVGVLVALIKFVGWLVNLG